MENENTSAAPFITIKGEQYSTDLERLDLRSRDLTDADIEPLKYMTNLTELVLFENQFSDISVLSGLVKLTRLDLWGNRISDISALGGLVNLAELDLLGNRISDISALNGLVNLRC
jgi:Leucine-rich repeat (LRR) protein